MSPLKNSIANILEGDWGSRIWWGVEGVEEGLERSGKEVEERIDEDNMLKNRLTQDQHFSLLPIKRLESYLLFRGEPQE